ncbi:MAG TPA: hypothetical protein VKX28_03735 [Xanthobacteraceae bacterium]|nr:hypothetical protein [Xanthobacteraceae bacterium]
MTAIAEWQAPSPSRDRPPQAAEMRQTRTAAAAPKSWFPTLWWRGGLTFFPFVVEKPIVQITAPRDLVQVLQAGADFIGLRLAPEAPQSARTAASDLYPRFRVAYPIEDSAMHDELAEHPYAPTWAPDEGLRGRIGAGKRITVIAVIDDGLPFANRNFRDESGRRSRVEFCWLQSVRADKTLDKPSVLFGREYTREQIEELIERHGDDEDALYRAAGATADTDKYGSLLNRHATHGGHVMDLATGYAPARGDDPPEEIRIIAVQLPNMVTMDTSGFGKDMYVLSAFHYIFDRADIIASQQGYSVDRLRLVINFSYGYSGGRHDGESEIEAAIDQLVRKRREIAGPTALVAPAGNTFLDRMHGKIDDTDFRDDVVEIPWRIQPNDRTPSYLEIWFWLGFDPRGFSVELRDPFGRPVRLRAPTGAEKTSLPIGADATGPGDPERVYGVLNGGGDQVGQVSADLNRPHNAGGKSTTGRWRVMVVIAPTEPNDDRLPAAQAGKWRVVIRRGAHARLTEHPVHFWIQRATDPESFRSGARQSYFDDLKDPLYTGSGELPDDTDDPDDPLYTGSGDLLEMDTGCALDRRFGSISGLATGGTTLVVGGYRLGDDLGATLEQARPSRYSSAGTVDPGWPDAQIDCSSMSDRSRLLTGTVAAGVRSGSLSLVQGTSSAAPFVARRLATVFVTADDGKVEQAKSGNYLSLLQGTPGDANRKPGDPRHIAARLGVVRVPPHRQPGLEPPNPRAAGSAGSD